MEKFKLRHYRAGEGKELSVRLLIAKKNGRNLNDVLCMV
jgi:hypothetical protein